MINTVFSFQYRHGGDLFTMNNLKLLSGYSILYLTACMVLLDLVANAMASGHTLGPLRFAQLLPTKNMIIWDPKYKGSCPDPKIDAITCMYGDRRKQKHSHPQSLSLCLRIG